MDGTTYCFLFMDDPEPRERRRAMIGAVCLVARGKFQTNKRVLGIATEKIEVTVDGGDRQVLGREADVGVSGIEFVLDHLVLLEIGSLPPTTCVRKQLFQGEGASAPPHRVGRLGGVLA